MGLLDVFLGPTLPRDQTTRIPLAARRAGKAHVKAMKERLVAIAALPGVADIAQAKRVPKGFFQLADEFLRQYEQYNTSVAHATTWSSLPKPGTPEGVAACYTTPMPVSALEALTIYRKIRLWRDFPQVVEALQKAADQQIKEIQSRHRGKDPERIPMVGRAIRDGRLAFAKRGVPCPFLDKDTRRCRIWEVRPINCRQHHIAGDVELANPQHPKHLTAKAKNIRLPVLAQVELATLDKRMALSLSPFLYVGLLQLAVLAEGQPIQEVGELPQRVGLDGRLPERANRDVAHAKKNQKAKKKGKSR